MSGARKPQTEWNGELARSLCLQADALHDRAEYAAVRVLYERALTIQERVAGAEHPDAARYLHGLARVQMRQDEDTQAGALLERALAIQMESGLRYQ